MFLVDTSDPRRQDVIEKNIEHIEALVAAARSHHRLGLATFDSNLQVEAPLGATVDEIRDAASEMRAVGQTTELYRNTVSAVRLLERYPAERKAIFLFSDGLAEDTAYHHQDVMRLALSSRVVIYSLGYARSVSLSVALQTLRRLSEESGGLFVAADRDYTLPPTFLDEPYTALDSGGSIALDLAPAVAAGLSGRRRVSISFAVHGRVDTVTVPVNLPTPPPVPEPSPPVSPEAEIKPAVTPTPPVSTAPRLWLWVGTASGVA
ncbi:MAG: VWA domain-containing protein, partial [bacterium]|nr:VWA domain-containing protein [bacterium]